MERLFIKKIVTILVIISIIFISVPVPVYAGGVVNAITHFVSTVASHINVKAVIIATVFSMVGGPAIFFGQGSFATFLSSGLGELTKMALDIATCATTGNGFVFSNCGGDRGGNSGGGGGGGGNGGQNNSAKTSGVNPSNMQNGGILTCPAGNKLCGSSGCIPSDASCCANIGVTDAYCGAGTYCVSDGNGGANCQANGSGTAQCSSLQGTKCVSAPNSCKLVNSAEYQCDGSCTVSTPSELECIPPDITLTTTTFTGFGKGCVIKSKITHATSCNINGTDVAVPEGTYTSDPITKTTEFIMTCFNGSSVSSKKSIICKINPAFQEF